MKIKRLVFFIISLVSFTAISGERITICGDDHFPPYSFLEDKKVVGIDVDVIAHVMKKVNVEVDIRLVPWKRLLMDLQEGRCDLGFSLFETFNRKIFADYLAPVHLSNLSIFINKASPFSFESMGDLLHRQLLIPFGFSISDDFDLARKAKQISAVEVRDMGQALLQISRGHADGYINNNEVVRYYISNSSLPLSVKEKISYLKKSVAKSRPAYLVVSKQSQFSKRKKLLEQIKVELNIILENGAYKSFSEKYLK